jgi:hypothetical protein
MVGKTRQARGKAAHPILRSRSRGKKPDRRRRGRATNRPRFLRARWWLMIRYPDAKKYGAASLGILLFVAFLLFRRSAAQGPDVDPAPGGSVGPVEQPDSLGASAA